MIVDLFTLVIGILFLWFSADYLVKGAASLAARLNIPPLIIGLTVVSFGTSAPELLVSLSAAALKNDTDMALGNIVGSNIANILLVLGACALIKNISLDKSMLKFELPFLLGFTALFTLLSYEGYELNRLDGFMMLGALIFFLFVTFKRTKGQKIDPEIAELSDTNHKPILDFLFLIGGTIGLVAGANFLVAGATNLALAFGVSSMFISLTVVALGTSLPELAASAMAAYRGETELCLGNVVGSNIFNIGCVLASTSIVKTITVEQSYLTSEFLWMGAVTGSLLFICLFREKMSKVSGSIFLLAYLFFILSSYNSV